MKPKNLILEKRITVLAAISQEQLENCGCDVEHECETLTEAKKRAKYYLSGEYMRTTESSTQLGYAQVRVNDECVADYFGGEVTK